MRRRLYSELKVKRILHKIVLLITPYLLFGIPMDFPIQIFVISIELSILYIKGHRSNVFLSLKIFLVTAKTVDPVEMPPIFGILYVSSLFANAPI